MSSPDYDGRCSIAGSFLNNSDHDGVGDEATVLHVATLLPIRFHPVVPVRDPLEKVFAW